MGASSCLVLPLLSRGRAGASLGMLFCLLFVDHGAVGSGRDWIVGVAKEWKMCGRGGGGSSSLLS